MIVTTSDINSVKTLFKNFYIPRPDSHKGQNGKILIIGGSSLFHAASLWAAEVASHFTDMVHYSSTVENEKIFHELKKTFRNGMIISKKDLEQYAFEDDVVLIGPGMMRDGREGEYTRQVVSEMIKKFPERKFVFDAGSLQKMDKEWLLDLKTMAIVTPHQKEFEMLFGQDVTNLPIDEKEKIVKMTAEKYHVVIILKAIVDIISDGHNLYRVEGGNAGLTKGGTGDVLAGLAASFYAKNDAINSALMASILLKTTAEALFTDQRYWYNIDDIIDKLPYQLASLI